MSFRSRIVLAVVLLGVLLIASGGCGNEPVLAPVKRGASSFQGGFPPVSSIALSPSSVTAGGTSTAKVTLQGSAPSGGEVVTLTSSNTAVATAPASVTVAAGSLSASFTVTSQAVTVAGSATVSASAGGGTSSAVLSVAPAGGAGGVGTVASVSVSPTTVVGGSTATGTVTLAAVAPAGGVAVGVMSNNTLVATVSPNLTVPAGSLSATFTITSHPVAAPDFAAISATAGQVTQTAVLNVNPSGNPVLSSLSISPTLINSGATATGTATLNLAAPAGGTVVALMSKDTTVATVPASVTVPAGASTATFTITGKTVSVATSVSINGSAGGVSQFAFITVNTPAPTGRQVTLLTINPTTVVGGQTAQGMVTLASAVGPDTPVTLTTTNAAVAAVPASVIVPAGLASATFAITTSPTTFANFAEIAAAAGGTSSATTITTVPPPTGPSIVSVVFFPASLGGTGPATGRVTLSGSATQGALVNLTSASPAVVQMPAQVVVSANTSRVDFPVTTSRVAANTPVTVNAVACCGGLGSGAGTITVTTAAPPPPDVVGIDLAEFIPGGRGGTLHVRARSTSTTAILTVFRDGSTVPTFVLSNLGGGRYEGSFSFSGLKPNFVTVTSNLGGSATSAVK
ncbi:MAG TPA: hypothetical protein VI504_03480 [Candidatus Eisenbacteria bacterium]|jgi:hypothetical protein